MNMVRSFLPVGQGAFYTEQFDGGVNVIYDCGSQTGVEIVEKMIESTFDKGEEIHAVFISHLHSDHINGLELLLKHCKVKTLYLPYLTPHNISISELIQDVTQVGCTQFVRAFIHDSHGTLKMYCERNEIELPEIKYVLSQDDANNMGQQIEPNDKRYLFPEEPVYIPVASLGARWKYIPYNVQNTERKNKLIDELKKIGVDANDKESIKRKMSTKSGIVEIRKAYEKVPGGLNTNSMVVYSGPDSKVRSMAVQRFSVNPFVTRGCYDCCVSKRPGCLYMGDFDASETSNFISLESYYHDYWREIGILQVPHHGSKHNFNVALLAKACFYIISAGAENKYKHPHAKVLKEIISHRQPFAWVSEKVDSAIHFAVSNR